MPVGDSITEGKYTQGGYRKPLYQMLKDNGYSVTFVGKEDNGDPPMTPDSPPVWKIRIMRDMAVPASACLLNGGTTEKHTALPLKTSLANNNPDVVLILLGTNDIFGITPTDRMHQTMEKLVRTIFEQNPNTTVVLASIPPISKIEARNADVNAYNACAPRNRCEGKGSQPQDRICRLHSVFHLRNDSGEHSIIGIDVRVPGLDFRNGGMLARTTVVFGFCSKIVLTSFSHCLVHPIRWRDAKDIVGSKQNQDDIGLLFARDVLSGSACVFPWCHRSRACRCGHCHIPHDSDFHTGGDPVSLAGSPLSSLPTKVTE